MVSTSKGALIFLGVITLCATAFLGVYGYHAVLGAGGESSAFQAQRFLYLAVLLMVVELLLFARVFVRSRNIARELDKLIEIGRRRGLTGAQSLKRLGPIGVQIERLYDELNSLSDRKTLKISSLSELAEFLMNNVSVPAAVATVEGLVVYVSRVYTERTKRGRNELVDRRVDELAPGILFAEIVAELDRTHATIQRKGDRGNVTFYPIRNVDNQLAYVVCLFQSGQVLVEQARRGAEEPMRRETLGTVKRFLDFGKNTARRLSGGLRGEHDADSGAQ